MRSMDGHTQPQTSLKAPQTHPTPHVVPIFSAVIAQYSPFSASLTSFLPLIPPTAHLAPLMPSKTQKRREQPPQPPSPALYFDLFSLQVPPFQSPSSTYFNLSPFNLRPELNTPVNEIQPKFNPLQPFAHFVFSVFTSRTTSNSLIYTLFIVFRLTPSLYISFSCPYRLTSSRWARNSMR